MPFLDYLIVNNTFANYKFGELIEIICNQNTSYYSEQLSTKEGEEEAQDEIQDEGGEQQQKKQKVITFQCSGDYYC